MNKGPSEALNTTFAHLIYAKVHPNHRKANWMLGMQYKPLSILHQPDYLTL